MKYGEEIYGQLSYGAGEIEKVPEVQPINLMSYLPLQYRDSRVMTNVQDSFSKQLTDFIAGITDVFDQFFVEKATWGLGLWESELGILTDNRMSPEYRRNVIKAKLQGAQMTTLPLVENLGEIFSGGRVDVSDYPGESRFVVKFIGTRGIPPNMVELTEAIETVKPAHLAFSYEYTYCVWSEASTYTWESARIYTWDALHIAKPRTSWTSSTLMRWDDLYILKIRPSWKYVKCMTWIKFILLKSNS